MSDARTTFLYTLPALLAVCVCLYSSASQADDLQATSKALPRVKELLSHYDADPNSTHCVIHLEETALTNTEWPPEFLNPSTFRVQTIQWASSGALWHANVSEILTPTPTKSQKHEWEEWWDGSTHYRLSREKESARCILSDRPPASGLLYDTLQLMMRRPGGSFLGRESLSVLLVPAEVIKHKNDSKSDELLLAIKEDSQRIRIMLDASSPLGFAQIQSEWPEEQEQLPKERKGEWILETSIGFIVESWMEVDGFAFPRVAYRRSYTAPDSDDANSKGRGAQVRLAREDGGSASNEQLPRSAFQPKFEDGWRIIDTRLRLIYTIGEKQVDVDGTVYQTTEPMTPEATTRLSEILIIPPPADDESSDN